MNQNTPLWNEQNIRALIAHYLQEMNEREHLPCLNLEEPTFPTFHQEIEGDLLLKNYARLLNQLSHDSVAGLLRRRIHLFFNSNTHRAEEEYRKLGFNDSLIDLLRRENILPLLDRMLLKSIDAALYHRSIHDDGNHNSFHEFKEILFSTEDYFNQLQLLLEIRTEYNDPENCILQKALLQELNDTERFLADIYKIYEDAVDAFAKRKVATAQGERADLRSSW